MPAQSANKATIPVGGDAWNPVAHIKKATETTRSIIPVATEAERNTLKDLFPGGVLPVPTYVNRTDQGNRIEKWDGSKWILNQHIEFSFNAAGIPNASLWGPGVLTLDTGALTTDQSLASSPGPDMIKLNKGLYIIQFSGNAANVSTGTSWFQIRKSDDGDVYAHGVGNEVWATAFCNFHVLTDNLQLRLRLKWTSGGSTTIGGRVRITKIG